MKCKECRYCVVSGYTETQLINTLYPRGGNPIYFCKHPDIGKIAMRDEMKYKSQIGFVEIAKVLWG